LDIFKSKRIFSFIRPTRVSAFVFSGSIFTKSLSLISFFTTIHFCRSLCSFSLPPRHFVGLEAVNSVDAPFLASSFTSDPADLSPSQLLSAFPLSSLALSLSLSLSLLGGILFVSPLLHFTIAARSGGPQFLPTFFAASRLARAEISPYIKSGS